MDYIVENEKIRLTASENGAEIVSIVGKADGYEYIWGGDKAFWSGHAPILFPYCCRLFEGYYTLNGKKYEGGCHGFARKTAYVGKTDGNKIIFTLKSNDSTRALYPFDFELTVTYTLTESSVKVEIRALNTGNGEMIYTTGGHPGFNLPMDDKTAFEDWYLEFADVAKPRRIVFSDDCFHTGKTVPFDSLEDGKILRLNHRLFDDDAIFLEDSSKSVTLKSDKSEKYVRVDFDGNKYVGLWHTRGADAPFLCIEPMNGIASFSGKVDDLEKKTDTFRLAPGASRTDGFTITVG